MKKNQIGTRTRTTVEDGISNYLVQLRVLAGQLDNAASSGRNRYRWNILKYSYLIHIMDNMFIVLCLFSFRKNEVKTPHSSCWVQIKMATCQDKRFNNVMPLRCSLLLAAEREFRYHNLKDSSIQITKETRSLERPHVNEKVPEWSPRWVFQSSNTIVTVLMLLKTLYCYLYLCTIGRELNGRPGRAFIPENRLN